LPLPFATSCTSRQKSVEHLPPKSLRAWPVMMTSTFFADVIIGLKIHPQHHSLLELGITSVRDNTKIKDNLSVL